MEPWEHPEQNPIHCVPDCWVARKVKAASRRWHWGGNQRSNNAWLRSHIKSKFGDLGRERLRWLWAGQSWSNAYLKPVFWNLSESMNEGWYQLGNCSRSNMVVNPSVESSRSIYSPHSLLSIQASIKQSISDRIRIIFTILPFKRRPGAGDMDQ